MSSNGMLSFRCQSCHLPLIINDSLLNLSTAQQKILTSDKSFGKSNNGKQSSSKNPTPTQLDEQDERLRLYKEVLEQTCAKTSLTDEEQILLKDPDEDEEYASSQLTIGELHEIEDRLLGHLTELDLNIDDLDDEKLFEIVTNIKNEEKANQKKIKENYVTDDPTIALINNLNLNNMNINNIEEEFGNPDGAISNRIQILTKMLNIISFKTDIDYPVCIECSENLINQLQIQYQEAMKEKNSYLQFLNKLNKQSSPNLTKLDASLNELKKLKEKYEEHLKEIKELEAEEIKLKKELNEIDEEISNFNIKKSDLLTKKNLYELELLEINDLNNQALNELKEKTEIYDKLKSSNVYSDVFNISYNGNFGTINDLRLGNTKNSKVSWMEINSALGQLVLLLSIIIKKLNLKIKGYKLIPMGSYSKIEKYETLTESDGNSNSNGSNDTRKIILECYSSGSSTFERLFSNNSLDQAMIGLLNIIKQMEDELKPKYDKTIELPYPINIINNKIGGLNIKLNRKTTDDEWTMACKFLITDVKYILAFASTIMI